MPGELDSFASEESCDVKAKMPSAASGLVDRHSYVVGVLAQAAVTKYYKLSGLNNESSLLPVLEAGKFKIKVPA